MINFFFVDKILPFFKKNKTVNELYDSNMFIFYIQRFGIGSKISKKINTYSGIHVSLKVNNNSLNVVTEKLKHIFINNITNLDLELKNSMQQSIKTNILLYTYRGDRLKNGLPLNGQRRRSNSKTVKKMIKY